MKQKPPSESGPGMSEPDHQVPEVVHADFEKLMNFLIDQAMQDLGEDGYVAPFGAMLAPAGVTLVRASDEVDFETMDPDAVIASLRSLLREQVAADPDLMAVGIVMEVSVDPGDEAVEGAERDEEGAIDALGLALEHRRGDSHMVFAPLVLDDEGALDIGAIWACQDEARIFPAPSPTDS